MNKTYSTVPFDQFVYRCDAWCIGQNFSFSQGQKSPWQAPKIPNFCPFLVYFFGQFVRWICPSATMMHNGQEISPKSEGPWCEQIDWNGTVVVVHHCSIQGLGRCEYSGLFCRLCCYFLYYLMLLSKADQRSRISDSIVMAESITTNTPLFLFWTWSQLSQANPQNTFWGSLHYIHLIIPWIQ